MLRLIVSVELELVPTLAGELTEAFTAAKDRSLRRAAQTTIPSYPLPWAATHAREARDLLGEDFWPYGVDANRVALTAFLRDARAQRVTDRAVGLSELFSGGAVVAANLWIAAAIITGLVCWDLAGHLPLPLGVLGHEGSTVIVGLNGLRLLRPKAWNRAQG